MNGEGCGRESCRKEHRDRCAQVWEFQVILRSTVRGEGDCGGYIRLPQWIADGFFVNRRLKRCNLATSCKDDTSGSLAGSLERGPASCQGCKGAWWWRKLSVSFALYGSGISRWTCAQRKCAKPE